MISVLLAVLIFSACTAVVAETSVDKDRFFSYDRFFLNQAVVDSISGDGKVQKDLNAFAVSFTDGIYAISAGDLKVAEEDLLKARGIWPEYFGTDFLLALVYEENGDYSSAARYYKSYLNKLKNYHAGMYRISGPMIRTLASSGIERYDPARELIKERLASYGIRLGGVRPVITPPLFLFPFFLIAALAGIYVLVYYWAWPYIKKQHRIKNPPEGFWVCRNCGADNPETVKECEECGRLRDTDNG
ncbi:MAG: hypothetical protein ABID83_04305 [Candidatus Omnitrophota bacterium]